MIRQYYRCLCCRIGAIVLGGALFATGPAIAQDPASTLEQLLDGVRTQGQRVTNENRAREQAFRENRDQRKTLLDATLGELRREQARTERLKTSFDANEQELETLNETLRIRIGDMGEMFGIVRQVASETKGTIESSLVTAQLKDRGDVANKLAGAAALPSIGDLRELQALLLEEMIESGKVIRFETEIEDAAGVTATRPVVRVGVFNAISENGFLAYHPGDRSLSELPRQPSRRYVSAATNFFDATSGNARMAIDPSRGNLLSLVILAPGLLEQVSFGGGVGYTILAMGAIGLIIAFTRLLSLQLISRRVRAQRKATEPMMDNPLGRVYAVYAANTNAPPDALELKLDEAIMRETPKLERFQGVLKVIAGVAPLMGLLGTVVGMIKTFQTITLFGTGDPKLMADGISQALVTTVEGLIVAIPLVFLHSLISSMSKELIEILEEQSAGMVARAASKG
jgi:biopolymer transport protein ExbB